MKIELGGGNNARGDGYLNLDRHSAADIQIDFENELLPFADDSVEAVYSAHCLEHVANFLGVLREVLRVCILGAPVEIRLPHWLHPMASCPGHLHVLSDRQVQIWCDMPEKFWPDFPKKFSLKNIHYQIDAVFDELRKAFPLLTDEQVAKYIPACCHEIRCLMEVVAR